MNCKLYINVNVSYIITNKLSVQNLTLKDHLYLRTSYNF